MSVQQNRVIVAGAGPVGLVAALVLAQAGIPVTVLERRATLNTASKASTFHPPTLAILDRLGLLAAVADQGCVAADIQYRTQADGVIAAFALDRLAGETAFPFRLHLEQSRLTPVILEALGRYPHAEVQFGAAVQDLESRDGDVAVRISQDGRDRVLTGAYLIGADGSHSRVRTALGIGFEGEVYADKILRVMTDAPLDPLLPGIAPVTYLFNGAKSVSFLQMPDCWRIILRVPDSVEDATALAPDWILARLTEVMPHCRQLPAILMTDIYTVAKRIAATNRVGRVCLAGDSAHVTNTRGGMNMNCGIHDGFVIAGAMAQAVRNGDRRLVDAAAAERLRVAREQLIPRTDRNVLGGQAWLDHLAAVAASPDETLAYLRTSAMLDMLPAFPAPATPVAPPAPMLSVAPAAPPAPMLSVAPAAPATPVASAPSAIAETVSR